MKSIKKRLNAFTIVELIVVITVIGILATIAIVGYGGWMKSVTENQAKSDLISAATAMESYKSFNGGYPSPLAVPNTFKASSGISIAVYPGANGLGYELYATNNDKSIAYSVSNNNPTPQKAGALDNGLVLELDAGDPASYPGTGTTWTDLSGKGNNATISGAIYSSTNGGTFNFNGNNSYINVGRSTSLNITNEITIGVLIKPGPKNSDYQGVVGYNDEYAGLSNGYGIRRTNQDSQYQFWVSREYYNNGVSWRTLDCGIGEWCYLVLTYKSGVGGAVWKNGVQIGPNVSDVGNIAVPPSNNLQIGKIADNNVFNGLVSTTHIYNRALTAAELQQNFNSFCGRYSVCM